MRLTRLYVPDTVFAPALSVPLSADQAHYVLRVLRMQQDDPIVLFNEVSGGWQGRIQISGKKADVVLDEHIQQPLSGPDVWLLAAPLKKEAWHFVLEKGTELGMRAVQPVLTAYTQTARVNATRDQANLMEASRQCERTDIPAYFDVEKLTTLLRNWDASRILFVALERADAQPALAAFQACASDKAALLIGPEGGFSQEERDVFARYDFIKLISLGSLILRAETAAMTALALYRAVK